eukprot:TRINITY_DN6953_c0_g1_i16.p1 TRINITY_DN6953_c0_g1~~TRINITY_DN6953_c0_g1_i16.p1  ORF type:complete len:263 (-),score=50.86 TRINITY_DN6953_c0_g1_i16:49-837(-)
MMDVQVGKNPKEPLHYNLHFFPKRPWEWFVHRCGSSGINAEYGGISMFVDKRKKTIVKPKKKIQKNTKRYELHKQAKASLGISTNLRSAVRLPPGEDINEWLAAHTIDFFNQTNLLFGSIEEFCDDDSCPEMSAGPNYKYLWADDTNRTKPISCPARTYVDNLFNWIQSKLDDESLFPTTMDKPFPRAFREEVKVIMKRLFRVFAHLYVHHFHRIQELQEEAHLNAAFKHFLFFVEEFDLIEKKELLPLAELIEKFTGKKVA